MGLERTGVGVQGCEVEKRGMGGIVSSNSGLPMRTDVAGFLLAAGEQSLVRARWPREWPSKKTNSACSYKLAITLNGLDGE